jgi:2-C-methyl-D-erythritol 4-phosphate cytidylyltransferase
MKKFAVIVAAGVGSRMKSAVPKQFIELKGKPVLWYTLNAFLKAYHDMQIIVVLSPEHITQGKAIAASTIDAGRIQITTGGPTRFHSVKNGLQLVEADSIVFVHDAVRCLITPELIHRCYEHAVANGSAIPAIQATDTIRIDNGNGTVMVDRNKVYLIQTPQTFHSNILKEAFDQPYSPTFTDEATVIEASGKKIHLAEGENTNIKITFPVDLVIAESLVK